MTAYTDFLSDELSEHKWLVEIEYYDTVGLTTGTLYYSTTVFGTSSTDTPASQLYEPRLLGGYNFSGAAGDVGQFGGLLPAREGGSVVLAQNMGDLDSLRLYSFDGRAVTIRHGGYSPKYGELPFADYAVVFNGEVEGQALVGIDTVTLKLRNKDTRLEFPIQDRFYSGGRYWLYFSGPAADGGTDDYVDCQHGADGTDAGLNFVTSPFTIEFQTYVESYPSATATLFSRGTTGVDGWTIRIITGTGELSFSTHNGVTQSTTSTALPLNKRVHVALVRNGAAATWYFDGVAATNSAGTHVDPVTAARTFFIGKSNGGSNYFRGFIDEVRIWATNRSEEEINTYMTRQLEAVEVAGSLRWYSKFDDGTSTTLSEEVSTTVDGTITGATWYASLQGGEDLQGVPLPDVFGQRVGFAPVLCDEPRLIYQVHSGSIYDLMKVFAGGATIEIDSTPYTSMIDFMEKGVTGTAHGKYDLLVTENGTWFRLGSAPNKPVTVAVKGDNTGGTGYGDFSTYRYTVADIVRYVICTRGPQPLVDPTDLDTDSFDDLNTANSEIVGDACYEEKTIAEVVAFLLGSVGAVGWFRRASGLFAVQIFGGSGGGSITLTEKDCEEDTLECLDVGPPIWGVDLNYRKNDLVHSTTDIAQAIITHSDLTPPDINWRFLMSEWRTVRPRRKNIRVSYKGATILQLDTAITLHAAAVAEAIRLLDLYKYQGQCVRGFFNQNAVQLDRMDTVTFHFQDIDSLGEYQSRLGTSDTSNFTVIAVEDDVESGGTWLTLYREVIS